MSGFMLTVRTVGGTHELTIENHAAYRAAVDMERNWERVKRDTPENYYELFDADGRLFEVAAGDIRQVWLERR